MATLIITTQLHHRNNTISILALLTKWPGTVDTTGIVDKISILALLTDLELLTKWPVFLQNASGNPSLESAKSGPGYRLDYITVYTTKKMPHESTRSIRIYFEIFSSGAVYEFATKVQPTFCHPLQFFLNWCINVVTVNSTQLSL